MLKKLCCDLKIINCASKAVICLDAIKKFLCISLLVFVIIKGFMLCIVAKD